MARPPKSPEGAGVSVTFKMPPDVYDRMETAWQSGEYEDRTAWLVKAVRDLLSHDRVDAMPPPEGEWIDLGSGPGITVKRAGG